MRECLGGRRASLIRPRSIRSFTMRRTDHETSPAATASATADASSDARTGGLGRSSRVPGAARVPESTQLVAELLDGLDGVGEDRQLLAQPPDVDVDGACAAGVPVAPHVGQQQIARQHAAAMLRRDTAAAGTPSRSSAPPRRRGSRCGARHRSQMVHIARFPRPAGAPCRRSRAAHTRHELLRAERLRDVVVGAKLEARRCGRLHRRAPSA